MLHGSVYEARVLDLLKRDASWPRRSLSSVGETKLGHVTTLI